MSIMYVEKKRRKWEELRKLLIRIVSIAATFSFHMGRVDKKKNNNNNTEIRSWKKKYNKKTDQFNDKSYWNFTWRGGSVWLHHWFFFVISSIPFLCVCLPHSHFLFRSITEFVVSFQTTNDHISINNNSIRWKKNLISENCTM